MFQKTDVSRPSDVKALVERAVSEFGRLDLAFNNAGVDGQQVPLHEQDIEKASFLFDVNIKGVFYCMKYEIEQMLKTGSGAIVNTSSIFGLNGYPGWSLYAASKHAVTGMTKAAALDYAKHSIRVNAVGPGPVETALTDTRYRRRPAQLRSLRANGAHRPARRDRRRRRVAALGRGPFRHRPHAPRRWRRLLAVTAENRSDRRAADRHNTGTVMPSTALQTQTNARLSAPRRRSKSPRSARSRHRSTSTTRSPIWSARRSGSNRTRQAERHGQPSSAQHPPRRTRELACLLERSGSRPPGSFA